VFVSKVLVINKLTLLPGSFLKQIEGLGLDLSLNDCQSEDEIISASRQADFIITVFSRYPFSRRIIEQLDKCRFIEGLGTGYDGINIKAATEHGIGIIHNAGLCKEELSDHAMALILACSRWIVGLHHRMNIGKPVVSTSLESMQHMGILLGKTLGIIGFGHSGRAIVPKARGFGMRILVYEGHVDKQTAKELDVEVVSMESLLQRADFISIHAALTPETSHLIGLDEFKKMKRSAFIINTSRGSIINEPDLCVALSEGYIAGAGLDVTDPEPPIYNSPLLKFDNLILTGHNAGTSPESFSRMYGFVIEEIARVLRGEWPTGLVNPEVKGKYVAKWGPMSEPN
jgi:D-3-phosphoglycerate dehydrogenase / 2-oxoglutarate reductase